MPLENPMPLKRLGDQDSLLPPGVPSLNSGECCLYDLRDDGS